jgi:hypothetical protein
MARRAFEKEVIRKCVADINEEGNTGGKFIDIATKNGFSISDLGVVIKEGDDYVWHINGVGKLIEKPNRVLILE